MAYILNAPPIEYGFRSGPTNPQRAAQMGARGMSGLGSLGADASALDPNTPIYGTNSTVAGLLDEGLSYSDIQNILDSEPVAGFGLTIGELMDQGYTVSDIAAMVAEATAPVTTPSTTTVPANQPAGVPDGSILTYQGAWHGDSPFGTQNPQKVLSEVSAALPAVGLQVRGSNLNVGAHSAFFGGPFDVTLSLQVANGQGGFGTLDDVISVINHAVYVATGSMPTGGSIPAIQRPGQPTTATGQPTGANPGAPTNLSQWFLQNSTTVMLVAGVIFLGPPLLQSVSGGRRR